MQETIAISNTTRKRTFVVQSEKGNKAPAVCKILNEVTQITDRAIKATFGSLDFNRISATSYQVNFTGQAIPGDVIDMESVSGRPDGSSLSIEISIHKRRRYGAMKIGHGSFVFVREAVM